jgi:preprotein translocase subunit SecF
MITFNIKKIRLVSYSLSLLLIGIFLYSFVVKVKERGSAFLYSIEFTGGYQAFCSFKETEYSYSIPVIQEVLEKDNYEGVSVRQFEKSSFIIRFSSIKNTSSLATDDIKENLISSLSVINNTDPVVEDISFIGPSVGEELSYKALLSIVLSLMLMFLYIWLRFPSWKFALANIVSLLHDIFIILLFLLMFDVHISLDILIAILFVVGYSINDTIVIFSSIRNTLSTQLHNTVLTAEIINISLQKTFKRTILTSLFTSLVVFPLWLFGGRVLADLSIPLLLGIVFGTYSSVAIASSVLYDLFLIK